MTDRDLMELAGRAAGYHVTWNAQWQSFQHHSPKPDLHGAVRHPWVPLEDDGDALRLAVDLCITVEQNLIPKRACAMVWLGGKSLFDDVFFEEWGSDKYAATRRAIVCAAAEVARATSELRRD